MKNILITATFFFTLMLFNTPINANNIAIDPTNIFPKVKLETSMGVMIVELDRVKAPITVNNF